MAAAAASEVLSLRVLYLSLQLSTRMPTCTYLSVLRCQFVSSSVSLFLSRLVSSCHLSPRARMLPTRILYKQVGTDYTYDKKCLLGKGSFSKVYKGWSKKREQQIAAKKIEKVFVFEDFAILGLGL